MANKKTVLVRSLFSAVLCVGVLTACFQKPWEDFTVICQEVAGSRSDINDNSCTCMANALEEELTKNEFASLNDVLETTRIRDLSGMVLRKRLVNEKVSSSFARVVKACKN